MPILDALISPVSSLLDRIIPDKNARDAAKLQLLQLQGTQELQQLQTQMSAIVAEANSTDPWTSRARPSFMYVMYIIILCSLPMGVLAAFRPQMATAIATGMNSYLAGIPDRSTRCLAPAIWATPPRASGARTPAPTNNR
jgi:hypothetical protein